MSPARPLVTVARVGGALRIAAADAGAHALGLVPGLTLADARARVPDVTVANHDMAADRAVLERLAGACDRYTPLVALDAPDGLMLDITGCAHLFGGEAAMLADVTGWLEGQGFTVKAAMAGSAATARAVARHGAGGIVAPGGEAAAVRPLPVAALGISPQIAAALAGAGLKTIADLAVRPRAALAARFGADVIARLDRTLGGVHAPVSPRRPVPALMVEERFAAPVLLEEAVRACLARLSARICMLLEQRAEGGRRFEAAFFRSDGHVRRIAIDAARPLRDAGVLLWLFDIRLAALADPLEAGFGFDAVRLGVSAAETLGAVQPCLDGREAEDGEVAALTERLGARLGQARIRAFLPVDSHDPDRAARTVPAIAGAACGMTWTTPEPGAPPLRPLFLFAAPQPVETLAEVPDGPPLRFRWRKLLHEVACAEGPERIAAEWWRAGEDACPRDYYRVEDAAGRRFWLYREGLYGEGRLPRWFLHGLFP